MKIKKEKKDDPSLVWTRMRGCYFWPSRIVETPPELGRTPNGKKCVLFFGTKQFGFVDSGKIESYLAHREKNIKVGRGAAFIDAVKQIDDFISNPSKFRSNGYAKPIGRRIQIKREPQAAKIKKENDTPRKYNAESTIQDQLNALTREKDTLIAKIVSLKTENQRMLLELKNEQSQNEALNLKTRELEQQISAHASEINILKQKINVEATQFAEKSAQNEGRISGLVHEKKMLEARVKELQTGMTEKNSEQKPDPEEIYEVEKLVGHKVENGIWFYRVRWQGYDSTEDTWERESNLFCSSILESYKKCLKNVKQ